MAANKDRVVLVTAAGVSAGRDHVELRQRPCCCAFDADCAWGRESWHRGMYCGGR